MNNIQVPPFLNTFKKSLISVYLIKVQVFHEYINMSIKYLTIICKIWWDRNGEKSNKLFQETLKGHDCQPSNTSKHVTSFYKCRYNLLLRGGVPRNWLRVPLLKHPRTLLFFYNPPYKGKELSASTVSTTLWY